jgi:hypothetical protein
MIVFYLLMYYNRGFTERIIYNHRKDNLGRQLGIHILV